MIRLYLLQGSEIAERRSSTDGKPYKKIKLAGEKTQKSSFSTRAKGKRTQVFICIL